MHIHLDLVGGIAGDMFLASLLDCFPEYGPKLQSLLDGAGFNDLVRLSIEPSNDGIISGTHVDVHPATDAQGHHHRHFSEIKSILETSAIDSATKETAIGIFTLLAEAEAKVHGVPPAEVAFHEVGAWDSIADIVCSAYLITQLAPCRWSMSTLPLGSGQVKTAHGRLPVPAPATSLLLEGFDCVDDGLEGERITPTGAAILKYLSPSQNSKSRKGRISRSGYGLGTKKFPGISNMLRCLVLEESAQEDLQSGLQEDLQFGLQEDQHSRLNEDEVLQLEFEIDDQTPEDLGLALDIIRDTSGVLDVIHSIAYGKKGRIIFSIRILAEPASKNNLLAVCFQQTTTLGIRHQIVNRFILAREAVKVRDNGMDYRVKLAYRQQTMTAKLEMEDLAKIEGSAADRELLRKKIEQVALDSFADTKLSGGNND